MSDLKPEDRENFCRKVFSCIASRYDFLNTVLSLNRDKYWRRFAVAKTGLEAGGRGLDVCCGTGRICIEQAKIVGATGVVIGLDFCRDMLNIAERDINRTQFNDTIKLVEGNALKLPFPDNTFDCATIGFGLRNVSDIRAALFEMRRVVRAGGRVVSLDLAKPGIIGFKEIYKLYLERVIPLLGRLGVGEDTPYRWLPESLKQFPHQTELCDMFGLVGLKEPNYYELTGGIVAVHVGIK
jgi:demethylmenaquinone methyltransferase / 2-methoxy-6-polyprenyl-1,4-benzoquinol methylase